MEDVSTIVTLASVMLLVLMAVGVTYFLFVLYETSGTSFGARVTSVPNLMDFCRFFSGCLLAESIVLSAVIGRPTILLGIAALCSIEVAGRRLSSKR